MVISLTTIRKRLQPACGCSFPTLLFRRLLTILFIGLILICTTACISSFRSAEQSSGPEFMGQGTIAFSQGKFGDAATSFTAASQWFEQQNDDDGQYEALISAGQANCFSGKHLKALENLKASLTLAKSLQNKGKTAKALSAIGNVHLALGDKVLSLQYLKQGLALAREADAFQVVASSLNDLGNLYLTQKKYCLAISSYREAALAAAQADNDLLAAQISINWATANWRAGHIDQVIPLLNRAEKHLGSCKNSTAKAYSLVNTALLYSDLHTRSPKQNRELVLAAVNAYNRALTIARDLNDQRTLSYVYGNLARLYENEEQYQEALELTRQAIFSAQLCNATEASYKWHWQNGKLFVKQGKLDEAIRAYRLAIRDLKSIRDEMSSSHVVPCSSSFYRKTAGIISFELVDLLLRKASKPRPGEDIQPLLMEARDTLEILKVYELREYFKDDCLDAARSIGKKIDLVSARAVVIYPVLLPDRVELLVSFAGKLKRYTLPVTIDELSAEALIFRKALMKRTSWGFLPHAQKLYNWLIRPLENDLQTIPVDTLVFVPDGPLRSIPMSALHDGKQFLINRYPIAITPSLILTDPQPIKHEGARLLALGITEPVQCFPGLPYVDDELKAIRDLYIGETLLNDQFTGNSLSVALKKEPYSIVHIASHGHFGKDVDDTFLLAFDEKITMDRIGKYVGLYRFREEPLDLITLSACETAVGDDRAALGLAGVAVRAGARSALATLWQVNDPASYKLVVEFYRQLSTPGHSRAAALQQAQLKLLNDPQYEHPYYWSPFLLINNWL